MNNQRTNLALGAILLLAGLFLLLVNFDILGDLSGTMWGLVFVAGGLAFVALYLGNRQQWWPIIPGLTLVGIGLLILLSMTGLDENWLPSILFLSIGAAFLVVYATRPAANWWAIIPAGVMGSLAMVVISGELGGAVIMLGLAATFGLVYLQGALRSLHQQFWWALIPAGVLGVIGLFLLAGEVEQLAWVGRLWPVVLILIGVGVLLRGGFQPRAER